MFSSLFFYNKGGDFIQYLINLFFISFILYLFIFLYSIYIFFDIMIFHNKQGSKLKIKRKFFT